LIMEVRRFLHNRQKQNLWIERKIE
jgi:hypothetical protein